MAEMRQEKDSLGVVEVPAGAMYGAQTQRAVENYPISGMRAAGALIRAIGMVKKAAAEANGELGVVSKERAEAIARAARGGDRRGVGWGVCGGCVPGGGWGELPYECE